MESLKKCLESGTSDFFPVVDVGAFLAAGDVNGIVIGPAEGFAQPHIVLTDELVGGVVVEVRFAHTHRFIGVKGHPLQIAAAGHIVAGNVTVVIVAVVAGSGRYW